MKPFLKWAGNKYRTVERIKKLLPGGKRLIEPFVGSGAVFLNTEYSDYLLNDSNADLIALFQILQKQGHEFIENCRVLFSAMNNAAETFYEKRALFNHTTDIFLKTLLFVYLNRHCFNGLCRYNANGNFNTPFGQYQRIYFPEKELHYFCEKAQRAIFKCTDFVEIMQAAQPGDIVYCDPPYAPLSKTANFTSYDKNGFSASQQELLANLAKQLAAQGILVVISNHDTEFTRQIYAGAKLITFDVQRFISSDGKKRGRAPELLAVFGE